MNVFLKFQRFNLTVQHRSKDPKHTAMINQMRDTSKQPVTKKLLDNLKCLTRDDLGPDSSWSFAKIVCTSNSERCCLNEAQAVRFAREHGEPVLMWYCPLRTSDSAKGKTLTRDNYDRTCTRSKCLSKEIFQLKCFFVRGAPCYVTQNINPHKTRIVNGSKGIMDSLTWENDWFPDMEDMEPGRIVEVPLPYSVNVRLDGRDDVIPMLPYEETKKLPKSLGRGMDNESLTIAFRTHKVELGFAITYHKIQGQTEEKLIIVLNEHRSRKLLSVSFDGLYVALTRVKLAANLRIWPATRSDLDYLLRLKHPLHLRLWNGNYNKDGWWRKNGLQQIAQRQKLDLMRQLKEIFGDRSTIDANVKKIRVPQLKAMVKKLGIWKLRSWKKAGLVEALKKRWDAEQKKFLADADKHNAAMKGK